MSLFAQTSSGSFSPQADSARVLTLAQRFAAEPELILACLDPEADTVSPDIGMVLAAALAAVEQRPTYADLKYFAAEAAIRAGRLETAAELLEGALRLNPRYNAALIAAGRVCFLREDTEGGVELPSAGHL
jgi:tetratricopeptide (TPR) repeat protein